DKNVLEYYAQPIPIKLPYATPTGRPVTVIHTPDFLLLEQNAAGWVECKAETNLMRLNTVQPHRYCANGQGSWRCPPGETAAKSFGLYYRVWSSAEADPILVRNIRFLEDYFAPDYPDIPAAIQQGILEIVKRFPGISAQAIVEKACGCTYEHL